MRNIVYYVATSLDGYIAGLQEDISGFAPDGAGVEKYLQDLLSFDTVIMGRKTYEFGYKFGLQPGQAPYKHMEHFIFSDNLSFKNKSENVHVCSMDLDHILKLRKEQGTDIYLCGGGQFASWLLEKKQITHLKLKLNPIVIGKGIKLFSDSAVMRQCELIDEQNFERSYKILTYKIHY